MRLFIVLFTLVISSSAFAFQSVEEWKVCDEVTKRCTILELGDYTPASYDGELPWIQYLQTAETGNDRSYWEAMAVERFARFHENVMKDEGALPSTEKVHVVHDHEYRTSSMYYEAK